MRKLAIATLCALSASAFAQSAANITKVDAPSNTFDKIKEQFDLGYSAEFYGPSINREGVTPTDNGAIPSNDLTYDSQVSVDYHLWDDKELTLKIRTRNQFGSGDTSGNHDKHDNGQMRDTRIGIQGGWYSNGNFSYWARYHVELPTSTRQKRRGLHLAYGAAQDFAYRLSDTVIVGFEQSTYFYAYDRKQDQNVFLYNSPYVNIALSDASTFKSRVEHESSSNTKDELIEVGARILTGVDFQLGNNWSLYPHISMGTDGQLFDGDTIGVNFWLSGAIF